MIRDCTLCAEATSGVMRGHRVLISETLICVAHDMPADEKKYPPKIRAVLGLVAE